MYPCRVERRLSVRSVEQSIQFILMTRSSWVGETAKRFSWFQMSTMWIPSQTVGGGQEVTKNISELASPMWFVNIISSWMDVICLTRLWDTIDRASAFGSGGGPCIHGASQCRRWMRGDYISTRLVTRSFHTCNFLGMFMLQWSFIMMELCFDKGTACWKALAQCFPSF